MTMVVLRASKTKEWKLAASADVASSEKDYQSDSPWTEKRKHQLTQN